MCWGARRLGENQTKAVSHPRASDRVQTSNPSFLPSYRLRASSACLYTAVTFAACLATRPSDRRGIMARCVFCPQCGAIMDEQSTPCDQSGGKREVCICRSDLCSATAVSMGFDRCCPQRKPRAIKWKPVAETRCTLQDGSTPDAAFSGVSA